MRSEYLVKSIIQQIKELRNEQSFQQIYDKAKTFCGENGIDFVQQYRSHRTTQIPARFEAFIIDSTIGQHEVLSSSTDFMNRIYFPWIDCMLVELDDRFSSKTLSMMKSISTVYPESEHFLNIDYIDEFSLHIGADINALKNVSNLWFNQKQLLMLFNFSNELLPFPDAFPQTIRMIKNSMTMPISQVTCERSFSKMLIITNYLRNSMSDKRLSDLTVLAIERDFDINYERVIDAFSVNHKNSRILLR